MYIYYGFQFSVGLPSVRTNGPLILESCLVSFPTVGFVLSNVSVLSYYVLFCYILILFLRGSVLFE